jgi:hypothetical protein
MTEDFLSFLWKYKLYQNIPMFWEGETIEVISPGDLNTDAGPDFTNARIKIGTTLWAGNVEIHLNASDWNLHNHDQNAAFDNVILHVAGNNDADVHSSKGRKIPTIEIQFDPALLENYTELSINKSWVPCTGKLSNVDRFTIVSWLGSIGVERLASKTNLLSQNLVTSLNDWEEIFYRQLARSFGFHVNAMSFELLAANLSYKILKKYYGDIFRTECLLFGVAGFLNDDYSQDDYFNRLKKEYLFLENKFKLKSIDIHIWKFLRLRPGNFPTIRLAQFAALINNSPELLVKVVEAQSVNELKDLLIHPLLDYWENHYSFSKSTKTISKNLGTESAHTIIINTIIPFLFIFGRQMGKTDLEERSVQFLEALPAENNTIIRNWIKCGLKPKNAFDSQALLHLKSNYCDKKRCMDCRIGIKLISGE